MKKIVQLEKESQELRARVKQLERLLQHRPYRKEPPAFVKENTQPNEPKPSGRPEGHEGSGRETPEDIHKHVELKPIAKCLDCGSPVKLKSRRIRPAVVIRKTSFGSQSEHGAQDAAVLMSFFQTARLQDENFLEFMHELAENRLRN